MSESIPLRLVPSLSLEFNLRDCFEQALKPGLWSSRPRNSEPDANLSLTIPIRNG